MMKISYFSLLAWALVFPLNSHAQNFYKWIDANGSTHYTTTPPPKNTKQLGTVYTHEDTISPSDESSTQEKSEQNQPQTIGDSFAIATASGVLEIPPLKDGESIRFNK